MNFIWRQSKVALEAVEKTRSKYSEECKAFNASSPKVGNREIFL